MKTLLNHLRTEEGQSCDTHVNWHVTAAVKNPINQLKANGLWLPLECNCSKDHFLYVAAKAVATR